MSFCGGAFLVDAQRRVVVLLEPLSLRLHSALHFHQRGPQDPRPSTRSRREDVDDGAHVGIVLLAAVVDRLVQVGIEGLTCGGDALQPLLLEHADERVEQGLDLLHPVLAPGLSSPTSRTGSSFSTNASAARSR